MKTKNFIYCYRVDKFSYLDETSHIGVKISTRRTELKFHPGIKNLHIISPLVQYQIKSNLMIIFYRLTIKQNLLKEIILDLLLLVMVMLNHVSKVSLMFLMVYIILIRCFKLEWMVKMLTGSSFE